MAEILWEVLEGAGEELCLSFQRVLSDGQVKVDAKDWRFDMHKP